MPKFGITHKRPRPWSRRAESDGSCVPPIKGRRLSPNNSLLRVTNLLFNGFWFTWCVSYLAFFGTLQLVQLTAFGQYLFMILMTPFMNHIETVQWFNYVFLFVLILHFTTLIVSIAQFRKRIVRSGLQVCPRCGYDLSNRVNEEPCPECGQQISRRELIRLWCKLLRSRI